MSGRQSDSEHGNETAPGGEPRHAGSGNYAADWISAPPRVHAGPDHQRGGGFGGPQDSESRGEPPADAPPRDVALPGEVPGAREAVAHGAGSTEPGERAPDAASTRGAGDECLRTRICELLRDDPHLEARQITVEVKDGDVYLDGEVPTPEMKSRAGALVAEGGGLAIHNRLRIIDRRRPGTEPEDRA